MLEVKKEEKLLINPRLSSHFKQYKSLCRATQNKEKPASGQPKVVIILVMKQIIN